MPDALHALLLALCLVGVYVSASMQAKARRAERGELTESSVVQTRRARLLGRVPNSAIGLAYYGLLAIASFYFSWPAVYIASLGAAALAAAVSLFLAHSLLFITRMPCANCWTGHVVNWLLLAILAFAHP